MRIASILLVFGVTLISSITRADTSSATSSSLSPEDEPSQVLDLTDDNFDAALAAHSLLLIKFYTPWCGYCQALAPEYESAAASLSQLADKVTMAQVDCSVHEEICIDHDIGSFPTIKLFRHGIPTLYDGPRQAQAITRYLLRQTLPAVTLLDHGDQDALATLRQSDTVVVVGSGSTHDDDDNAAYTTFKTLANEWRDRFLFGWVVAAPHNNNNNNNNNNNSNNGLVLYTRFEDQDDQVDVYPGDMLAIDDIKTFILQHVTPLFGPIGPDNYLDYELAALPLAYLFIDPSSTTTTTTTTTSSMLQSFHDAMVTLAQHYRGKINFVYIDATAYPEQAEYLGINTTATPAWPAFVIQDADYQRYVLSHEEGVGVDMAAIQHHVTQFLAHTLTPFILSDPIPDDGDGSDGPVQVVVGAQFHDLVTNADQDVLLKVYAPWCGHCKALAPVWQQLGALVQQQGYPLRVASMDGTSNDMPMHDPAAFDVEAFPTIAFIESKTHRVALYPSNANRTLEGLVDFIHEQQQQQLHPMKLQLPPLENEQEIGGGNGNGDSDSDSDQGAASSQDSNSKVTMDKNKDGASGGDEQIRTGQVHDEL